MVAVAAAVLLAVAACFALSVLQLKPHARLQPEYSPGCRSWAGAAAVTGSLPAWLGQVICHMASPQEWCAVLQQWRHPVGCG
jgi:hypothetical protein